MSADRPPLPRQAAAELIGAFFLTLAGAGMEMLAVLYPGHIDRTMKAAAPASVVAAMIYSIGDISGAHLNPVVTTAFAVRRAFQWRCVPIYWLAQISGALLAALILRALFGTVGSGGANVAHITHWRAVVIEVLVTALLIVVILNTAHKQSLIGTEAAIAVGATLFVCGLLAGEWTTASMNPARSLGPAVVGGHFEDLWVFILGPFAGCAAAVGIMAILRPVTNQDEATAAQGSA
ncbi:MAG TPA: aquaporin [Ilumatobacteraceae bacterium]